MTDKEIFYALRTVQKMCKNIRDCDNCIFHTEEVCGLTKVPKYWEIDECKEPLDTATEITKAEIPTDILSSWHEGYDTGYKVGKNETLLKMRDYINEMRE